MDNVFMILIGLLLIYLAIGKKMEPALLLPIGFGTILVNSGAAEAIDQLFKIGISGYELFPLILFIGIGAMIDFEPLLADPKLVILGATAQGGILITFWLAKLIGFAPNDAASIAIIGAADGPTSIFVAQTLNSNYMAAIMVAAYSYMALIPMIQPPVIRLCTTKEDRKIRMQPITRKVPKIAKIIFPIGVTVVACVIAPKSASLIGFLMLGNLIRSCGVLDNLSKTAQNELANLVTIFLGIAISARMRAAEFLRVETLAILGLGFVAFVADTFIGVISAKVMNLFLKKKINPMIGAAGISAFPMAARVVHQMGLKEDNQNHLLMPAVCVNVSGQIFSAIIGGLIIAAAK